MKTRSTPALTFRIDVQKNLIITRINDEGNRDEAWTPERRLRGPNKILDRMCSSPTRNKPVRVATCLI